jgi:hypothetical protein
MPHIRPIVILNGKDVSRYFISSHSEQTSNAAKDPNKYDLVLANVGGYFFKAGSFAPRTYEEQVEEELGNFDLAPKHRVSLRVQISKEGCEGTAGRADMPPVTVSRTITIFHGEIQKAEADELFLKIEGSCSQGGMTSRIHDEEPPASDQIYNKLDTITAVVEDLLTKFGIPKPWHINPAKDTLDDQNPYLGKSIDFDTAFTEVAAWAQSIYYFDENDEFWFTGVTSREGFSKLTGVVLRGSNASTMVGYANHIDVYGGTLNDGETINERKTHNTLHAPATAPDIEIQSQGLITAPPVTLEDASIERCQEVANNLLAWYRQYKDVPTIKVVNKAPGLMSKVAYRPWNGDMPPVSCLGEEEATIDPVYGIVTRRVVDLSAEGGLVCSLDVTTNFQGMPRTDAEQDIWNYYPQDGSDPEIHFV